MYRLSIPINEAFEAFCWKYCRGKGLVELPIEGFHRELISLVKCSRVAVAAPRHFAKSSYFGRFYPAFVALEDAPCDVMIVSATSSLAEEHLTHIKALLRKPNLVNDFGSQETKNWRIDEVRLANGSKIVAKGAGKQIRGFHPKYVICDDLETDELVANPDRLKRFEYWFWTDVYGTLPADGQLIVIGTLLNPESFLANLINNKRTGWETRFYQAIKKDGTSLWERKWPIRTLHKMRVEMGQYEFEQEYMNNPIADDLRKFKKSQFKYWDTIPTGALYFTTIDPAIEVHDAADCSAIVTCAVDMDENLYIAHYTNKRLLPSELIDEIFLTFDKYEPQTVGIEMVGFQKMLKLEIEKQRRERNKYPNIVELKSEGRRKALRIEALQPRFEAGKIFLKRGMEEMETQLLRFPSPRCRDDLIDALAYQLEIIRPSKEITSTLNPECFLAEVERRRHNLPGRGRPWGNHKLMRSYP